MPRARPVCFGVGARIRWRGVREKRRRSSGHPLLFSLSSHVLLVEEGDAEWIAFVLLPFAGGVAQQGRKGGRRRHGGGGGPPKGGGGRGKRPKARGPSGAPAGLRPLPALSGVATFASAEGGRSRASIANARPPSGRARGFRFFWEWWGWVFLFRRGVPAEPQRGGGWLDGRSGEGVALLPARTWTRTRRPRIGKRARGASDTFFMGMVGCVVLSICLVFLL